jgi:hypothetical protein
MRQTLLVKQNKDPIRLDVLQAGKTRMSYFHIRPDPTCL